MSAIHESGLCIPSGIAVIGEHAAKLALTLAVGEASSKIRKTVLMTPRLVHRTPTTNLAKRT